jgi:hypothetical protein
MTGKNACPPNFAVLLGDISEYVFNGKMGTVISFHCV